ncbi:MAG: polyhydroxyalkanoate synthesis protein PhaF [Actinomycetota bacterium]
MAGPGALGEALRGYLAVASGLGELTRQRAVAVARTLLAQGEATAGLVVEPVRDQVQGLADELVATGRANRDLLVGLVRVEVERRVAALGLATGEQVAELADRVARLERQLALAQDAVVAAEAVAAGGAAGDRPAAAKARRSSRSRPAAGEPGGAS